MAKLIPMEAAGPRLVPVNVEPQQQTVDRQTIDQPLLQTHNNLSVTQIPAAALILGKQMIFDLPASMGAFVGGAGLDVVEGFNSGKWSLHNARNSYETIGEIMNAPVAESDSDWIQGGNVIAGKIFEPLEKVSRRAGEIVTDLTGSDTAGAITYATAQVLPFVLAGGAVRSRVLKNQAKTAKEFAQTELDKQMKMQESPPIPEQDMFGLDYMEKAEIFETKADLIDSMSNLLTLPDTPETRNQLVLFKQAYDAMGKSHAGEIPDGTVVELTKKVLDFKPEESVAEQFKRLMAGKEGQRGSASNKPVKSKEKVVMFAEWRDKAYPDFPAKPGPELMEKVINEYKDFRAKAGSPIQETKESKAAQKKLLGTLGKSGEWIEVWRQDRVDSPSDPLTEGKHWGTKEQAKAIADRESEAGRPLGKLHHAYIQVKNPLKTYDGGFWEKVISEAKSKGNDTIVYDNEGEGVGGKSYIPLSKEQIKVIPVDEKVKFKAVDTVEEARKAGEENYVDHDPLDVEADKQMADALTAEPTEAVNKVPTKEPVKKTRGRTVVYPDVDEIAKNKEMVMAKKVGADGTPIVDVTDKFGNKASFSLTQGGATLKDIHDYVKTWTEDFGQLMAKGNEIKSTIVERAPELVAVEKPAAPKPAAKPAKAAVKKPTTTVNEQGVEVKAAPAKAAVKSSMKEHKTASGEIIKYSTVEELKQAYAERGLSWVSSKGDYYATKKATAPVRKKANPVATEEDIEKLEPLQNKPVPQPDVVAMSSGKGPPEPPAPPEKLFNIKGEEVAPPTKSKGLGLSSWMAPTKAIAQDIQQRTGFPFYKFYELITEGQSKEMPAVMKYQKRLKEAKSGIDRVGATRVYRALERPAFREAAGDFEKFKKLVKADKKLSALFGDMKRTEFESANKIRSILSEAGEEFGIPMEKMILDYAPRMLPEGVQGWADAIVKWKLPEEYKWAAEQERTGYLMPHDENIFRVVSSYINRGAHKQYVGNYIEQMSKEMNKAKLESEADKKQILSYVEIMRGHHTALDETAQRTGQLVANALNKAINKSLGFVGAEPSERYPNVSYRVVTKKDGSKYFVKGEESPGFFDTYNAAQDFINLHLKLSYAGAQALRPMVFVRDLYQSLLGVPIIGPKWYKEGMKELAPNRIRESWAESKASGALLDEAPVASGELSRGWTILDDMVQKTTVNATKGNDIARNVLYHGMKKKVEHFGAKFLDRMKNGYAGKQITPEKAAKMFIDETGADFFHPELIKQEIIPLLEAGDITSLAERMALQAVRETQWLYRKGNAPYWARGMVGRVLGQFGVWPSWYLQYVKNMTTRGSYKNRAIRIGELGAINALGYEFGKEIFGIDITSWMLTSPFQWFPIPVQAWEAVRAITGSSSDYDKQKASQQLENLALMHAPAYLAVKDVIRAQEEDRFADKAKRFMGFKPYEE